LPADLVAANDPAMHEVARKYCARICAAEPGASNTLSMRGSDPTSEARRRLLTRLLDSHGERLYATLFRLTLRREVATELLQELFARLAGSQVEAARDPAAYAGRTAINLAMEWRRRRVREPAALEVDVVSNAQSPSLRIERAEDFDRLLAAVEELSEASREAFVLRFLEHMSYDDAAATMEKTPHQVRGLCSAAVRQLQEKFAKDRV
jgi:RNA polymerase sigma factor (sigma-70 family)